MRLHLVITKHIFGIIISLLFLNLFFENLQADTLDEDLFGSNMISAEKFWDYYNRNSIVRMKRYTDRYELSIRVPGKSRGSPILDVLHEKIRKTTVSIATLRAYDYASDPRFTLITKKPKTVADAYKAIENMTYPYRIPAPYGPEHMAELFKDLRTSHGLSIRHLSISKIQRLLAKLIRNEQEPSKSASLTQPIAALAWFLGEKRDVSSASVIFSIINKSDYVGEKMHFSAVDSAFNALWKINAKSDLPKYINWMRRATETGRRKMATLIATLLSTDTMLNSRSIDVDDFSSANYWEQKIARIKAKTQHDWNQYDVNSLYWEFRYLAALRLPKHDVFRNQLKGDVVSIIANAARQ